MKQLTVKDLINAGLFSVLMMVMVFAIGMIGFFPVTMPFVPFIEGLLIAPVFMLYSTKIKNFGMVMILGTLMAILFAVSGHGIYVFISFGVAALLSEYALKKGEYRSLKQARLAFVFFMLSFFGHMLPLYLSREQYIQQIIDQGYGEAYAQKLMAVLPMWSLFPVVLGGCLGGYIGATIGISLLRKHFVKAGMA